MPSFQVLQKIQIPLTFTKILSFLKTKRDNQNFFDIMEFISTLIELCGKFFDNNYNIITKFNIFHITKILLLFRI